MLSNLPMKTIQQIQIDLSQSTDPVAPFLAYTIRILERIADPVFENESRIQFANDALDLLRHKFQNGHVEIDHLIPTALINEK